MHVDMHRGLELGKGIIKTIAISRPNILGTCMSKNTRLCFNLFILLLLSSYLSRIPTSPKCFSVGSCKNNPTVGN